jgi:hypothetical protein
LHLSRFASPVELTTAAGHSGCARQKSPDHRGFSSPESVFASCKSLERGVFTFAQMEISHLFIEGLQGEGET